ncbi:MAG: hypothetical protein FJZ15_05865, partial [Candidatus Omnitrophica bacterium]|nr:hypothetical protein [Candidatus Omnitrophota bacterium]
QVQSQDDFVWPVKGRVVSHYGSTFKNMLNKGLNIESSGGQDIVASRSGRVVFYSPKFKGYGKAIIIDHGDNFSTVYSGNFESQVKPGDSVIKGNAIARFNPAGNKRLHFEIRKGSYSQNPYFYLQ